MDDDIKKLKPVRLKVVQVKRDAVGNCWRALDDPVQVSLFGSPVIVRFLVIRSCQSSRLVTAPTVSESREWGGLVQDIVSARSRTQGLFSF